MTTDSDAPHALLGYVFRACVAFYNAKPWQVLAEADRIRINIDHEPPIFAVVTGADTGAPRGLSLHSAYSAEQELEIAAEHPENPVATVAFAGVRLSVVLGPEVDAPQALRDMRRANKWPLAAPVAFPDFVATERDGTQRELHVDELRALGVAINVVASFVATKRKQIASREPHGDLIRVRDDAGVLREAIVQFPFDENDLSGWKSYQTREGDSSVSHPALRELRNAALELPDVSRMLDRLVWSFFQDVGPTEATHEDDEEDAYQRFLAWALFAHRTKLGTMAERALLQLEETKSSAELAVHRRIVAPRVGVFRVIEVERNVGVRVHDLTQGGTLTVVDRWASRMLREENGMVGMLHPISDTQWIMAPGTTMYPSLPDVTDNKGEESVERFALDMEAMTFGANVEWIQALTVEQLPDAYEAFAECIRATGDVMFTYAALQDLIARTDKPGDVAQQVNAQLDWWTDVELNLTLAFVMRAWNATPRAELGGRSPDEMAVAGERVRAVRPGGGRRRR